MISLQFAGQGLQCVRSVADFPEQNVLAWSSVTRKVSELILVLGLIQTPALADSMAVPRNFHLESSLLERLISVLTASTNSHFH